MRKNILERNGFVDFSFVFGQSFLQPRNCIEIFLIVVALPTQFVAIISCALNFINKCIKKKWSQLFSNSYRWARTNHFDQEFSLPKFFQYPNCKCPVISVKPSLRHLNPRQTGRKNCQQCHWGVFLVS